MASEGLLGPAEIRQLAEQLDLAPTKRHGQNFVIDPNTVRKLVRLAEVSDKDWVLEVGPGLGSLTLGLLETGARVSAIEIDPRLAQLLPQTVHDRMPDHAKNLTVITGDAVTSEMPEPFAPNAFVANLPYNVAVPIIVRALTDWPSIQTGLWMVQLEVAQRLVAQPGNREYGVPSVKLQWFGQAEFAGTIGPKVFWPAPRVDSGLVRFTRRESPPADLDQAEVFAAIDAGFSQRRKKLRSALANWAGGLPQADAILNTAGIDPAARAESLTINDFCAITAAC